jgi:hypothetical protein
MTTVPELINTISHDVQHVFEELMKLLLRKTLRPTLNPFGPNTKNVYNPRTGKVEKKYPGGSPTDNINKYSYSMTHDCLGWVNDSITTFKSLAKFIRNNYPPRHPQGAAITHNAKLSKTSIAYSERQRQYLATTNKIPLTQYKNFLEIITSRNMQNIISNRKAYAAFICDVPYMDCFKQLESIGRDIINQTDPTVPAAESALMSTAWLRVKLYNLEEDLLSLSINYPDIYSSYLCMVKLINSVPRNLMPWVINLVATLSYQNWSSLSNEQQQLYINMLGQCFVDSFNCNELITILLQGNASELILTSSYLYSLLKMLFVVFGYSQLTPEITTTECSSTTTESTVPQNHINRYRGAGLRRGDKHTKSDSHACCESCASGSDTCSGSSQNPCVPNNPCEPDCLPVDQCLINFIAAFNDLYPTIVSIMGGIEYFPPECAKLNCGNIPASYACLECVPDYLWRFNNYSYCQYLDYLATKQITNILASQITTKVHYLQTL